MKASLPVQPGVRRSRTLLCSAYAIVLSLFLFVSGALAQTFNYPVPAFDAQVWTPPTTNQVWQPPTTEQVWVPPSVQNTWVPPTTTPVWVPPVTHVEHVPAVTQTVYHPPVTHTVHHPAVTQTVHHDAVTHTVHHDAVTHTVHHDAVTHTVHHDEVSHTVHHDEEIVWGYQDGYWYLDWVEGYWWTEWVPSEYNSAYGEYVDHWEDGYYDYFWQEGYDYIVSATPAYDETVVDQEAYDETVVDQEAYDETVVDQEAYDETVVDQPAYDETVVVQEAYDETVVDQAGYDETVVVTPAHDVTVVDQEGHYINQEVPGYWRTDTIAGYWQTVEVPGRYITVEVPGYWSIQTIAASVLSVLTNGQTITGISWSTGRSLSVPGWVSDFLNNPNWSLNEPEEGGDPEDSTEFTEAVAFAYSGTLKEEMERQQSNKRLRRGPGGRWQVKEPTGNMTEEEAIANAITLILIAAQELTRTRTTPESIMVYITYEKLAIDTTAPRKVYTGRTSGWGLPENVLDRRDQKHMVQRPQFGMAIPNTIVITRGWSHSAWGATRGREQNLMDYHDLHDQTPGAPYTYSKSHSENARPTPTRPNGTRGVAKDNEKGYSYHDVSVRAFLPVWAFTGNYPVVTEYFSWPPPNLIPIGPIPYYVNLPISDSP